MPIRFQINFKLSPFALLLGALFADRTGAVLPAEIGGHTEVPNRQDVQREAGGQQHADRDEEICNERLAICERQCLCYTNIEKFTDTAGCLETSWTCCRAYETA